MCVKLPLVTVVLKVLKISLKPQFVTMVSQFSLKPSLVTVVLQVSKIIFNPSIF